MIPANTERAARIIREMMGWDFASIKRRHAHDHPTLEQDYLDQLFDEYRRYIALVAIYPIIPLPISIAVDQAWHTHLWFTHDYQEMCAELLGSGFIHHNANVDEDTPELRAAANEFYKLNTLRLYREHFGEPNPKFWPTDLI